MQTFSFEFANSLSHQNQQPPSLSTTFQQNQHQQQQQQQQQQSQQIFVGVNPSKAIQRKSILKNTSHLLNLNLNSTDLQLQHQQSQSNIAGGSLGSPASSPEMKAKKGGQNTRRSSKFSLKSDDRSKRNGGGVGNPAAGDVSSQQPHNSRKIDIFNIEEEGNSKYPKLTSFLESLTFQLVIAAITVFALFGDDIRVIASPKSSDDAFDVVNIVCIVLFLVQIIIQCICEVEYRNSFFFWLDLISTLTMVLDIQSVTNAFFFQSNVKSTLQITRASRASRIGTKAGRIVRIIRLIRIARIYKQSQEKKKLNSLKDRMLQNRKNKIADKYKFVYTNIQSSNPANNTKYDSPQQSTSKNRIPRSGGVSDESQSMQFKDHVLLPGSDQKQQLPQHQNQQQLQTELDQQNSNNNIKNINTHKSNNQKQKESRVSKRLSDLTTKRVVIIILLLLFIMPLFQKSFYFDLPVSIDYHTSALAGLSQNPKCSLTMLQDATHRTLNNLNNMKLPFVLFSQPFTFDNVDFIQDGFNGLRDNELLESYYDFNLDQFIANHPKDEDLARQLIKGTDQRFYWSIMSIRDQMVLQAILSLSRTLFVCIVLTTASFFFSKDANELALGPIERMITKVNQIANDPLSAKDQELIDEAQDQYETRIIENAIIKIGALLALGFGEAGSEIIGSNIAKHGDVDPMISGKKKCAIYGFCDIRNFTDATEVLQEDVMIFVNNIGEIVHSMVDRFMGAANKNIGDAFLLVWKFKEDKYSINDDNTIDFSDIGYAQIMAEFALISFMKIHAKMNREPLILEYRNDPRLNQRMANYKVKIGFGLHIGWSIEGAIGSEFKIDASYLSPNVSMSSRLEGATKGYGVPLLFSSDLHVLLSEGLQLYTRQVDYVMIKGQAKPIGFYTIDMKVDNLPASKLTDLTPEEKMEVEKHKKSITRSFLETKCFDVETFLQNDKDLRLILEGFDMEFVQEYNYAFELYINGNWSQARRAFLTILASHPEDGPSKATLDYMQEYDFSAPVKWQGYKAYHD